MSGSGPKGGNEREKVRFGGLLLGVKEALSPPPSPFSVASCL